MSDPTNSAATVEGSVSLIPASKLTATFKAEWLDLVENTDNPNPFFAPWFLEPAIRFLDPENEVRLCVIRHGEKMIGLAPVTMGSTYVKIPLKHYSVWKHDHCYNGAPLIRRGCDAQFYKILSIWIDQHPSDARFIRFTKYPYPKEVEQTLSLFNAHGNTRFRIQHAHERAILTHRDNFETHMASVYSGKKRKELRRQAKRFEELGSVEFELTPIDEEAIDSFVALENAGWKSAHMEGFPIARSDAEYAFFKNAMLGGAECGGVTCLSLNLDGKPAAILFSLRAGARLYAFKTTYDEKYAAYSPGTRLIIEATRHMLDDPSISLFDSCARAGHPVVDSLWPERLRIAQFNISASSAMDRNLLSLAAGIESVKIAVAKHFRHEPS